MDAIEKAVRNALEKGDAEDKNFRRRVYVSARHALEKSMQGKRLTQALADEKFSRLSEVAAGIESEFSNAQESEEYLNLARRSYEAAAPQVDVVGDDLTAAAEDAVLAEPVPVAEIEAAPEMQPAQAQIEEAVTSFEREPDSETARLEAIVAEIAPQAREKPAKKPQSRRKSAKKAAAEEASALAETSGQDEDLFEKSVPDWKEVSLPATYGTEPAAADPPAEEAGIDTAFEGAPETDMQAEDPDGVSAGELDDLRALDEVQFDERDPFEEKAADRNVTGAAQQAEDLAKDEPHYEVRPASAEMEDAALPAPAPQRPEPKRGWAFLFILITLLAFFVMALWIAFTTGALKIRGAADAPASETVTVAPIDEPQPPADKPVAAPVSDDWLMIFRPDNPGDLVVDPTIKADITGQGPLARLRIEPAPSTTGDAAVVFSIGEGILQQLAGKKAVFDIVAAADKGKPTQISVLCDFAGLGDCGRKRYQIDDATSDNLFQIEFPGGAPQGAGEFILNPDVDGKGRALIIYAIKVRVAN